MLHVPPSLLLSGEHLHMSAPASCAALIMSQAAPWPGHRYGTLSLVASSSAIVPAEQAGAPSALPHQPPISWCYPEFSWQVFL